MKKTIKVKRDLSLDKLSVALENPPTDVFVSVYTKEKVESMPSKDRITLRQMMIEGFAKMEANFKQVNTRLDNLETRLDYIVKVNNLKDLPKSK